MNDGPIDISSSPEFASVPRVSIPGGEEFVLLSSDRPHIMPQHRARVAGTNPDVEGYICGASGTMTSIPVLNRDGAYKGDIIPDNGEGVSMQMLEFSGPTPSTSAQVKTAGENLTARSNSRPAFDPAAHAAATPAVQAAVPARPKVKVTLASPTMGKLHLFVDDVGVSETCIVLVQSQDWSSPVTEPPASDTPISVTVNGQTMSCISGGWSVEMQGKLHVILARETQG